MTMVNSVWGVIARAAENDAEFDPDIVSPGAVGFLATGVFALAVIFLGVTLVRRLRRNAYRAEARELIAEELAERAEAAGNAGGEAAGDSAAEPIEQAGDSDTGAADDKPADGR